MADLPPYPDSSGDAGTPPHRDSTGSTPRWLGVLAIFIAIAVILAIIVLHLTGTIGPGSH